MSNDQDTIINMATAGRPSSFTDMIGQPFIQGLGRQIGSGKISGQGYIISGPKGCGKTTAARIIAKSLNCENRETTTGDPCNECPSCLLVDAGHHPQISEINAAANRGIHEVKEVLSTSVLAVPRGYRVFIFDEAHMFTKDAFSVLLKPMEEPPAGVIYIMATTNPEAIPETILSRSPIIPVLPLTDEELGTVLNNTVRGGMVTDPEAWSKVTDEDIDNAILAASGSARQAITNLSSVVFHGVSDTVTSNAAPSIAESMLSGSVEKTLLLTSEALKEKTSDPVTLISAVMDILMKSFGDNSTNQIARMIAELSLVSSQVSSSSPAMIIAARIAACVPNSVQMTQSTTEPVKGVKWTLDAAIHRLLDSSESKKILSNKWRDVLDNPDKSDIRVDKKGTVTVSVPSPDQSLRDSVHELLGENVNIVSKN